MEKTTNKVKVTVGVLLFLSALGLSLLYFRATPSSRTGVFATAASAQPGTVTTPVPTQPADPIYIKFDGIDGESQDREHRDWIDALSFSQGQYLSPSSSVPGGAARGKVVFEEFTIKKMVDKASPKLAEALCKGTVFPNVDIHVARPLSEGTQVTYYTYELKNVIVTSYQISGSTQDDVPTESLSLSFEQIKATYTKFDAAGRAESTIGYSWDLARSQPGQ
jgi:type VI secretion system secreted protein Hcp